MNADVPLARKAQQAVNRAVERLESLQKADGSWDAPCEFDPSFTAFYLLFLRYLGVATDELTGGLARYISAEQLSTGGWSGAPDQPPDLDVSVLCYAALRAAGVNANHPDLVRARPVIDGLGGLPAVNVATRFVLVLTGQMPFSSLTYLSPRVLTRPRWLGPTPDDLGAASLCLTPVCVLASPEAVRPLPPARSISELVPHGVRWRMKPPFTRGRNGPRRVNPMLWYLIRAAGGCMLAIDKSIRPVKARKEAARLIAESQDESGTFFEMLTSTALNLMALSNLGFDESDECMVRGLSVLSSWLVRTERGIRQQLTPSTCHETARTLAAILAVGRAPDEKTAVRAIDWLRRSRNPAGAWPFGVNSNRSADPDTTSIVLEALELAGLDSPGSVEWLVNTQAPDGGWRPYAFNVLSPALDGFAGVDDHISAVAGSHVDITARVITALARGARKTPRMSEAVRPAIERGLSFLLRNRDVNGAWPGRWVSNYTYGTAQVLEALAAVGIPHDDPRIAVSLDWLVSKQNADGGWGELKTGYATGAFQQGPSNVMASSFVLRALLLFDRVERDVILHAVQYLVTAQGVDGAWEDPAWNGVLLPRTSYMRYDLTPTAAAVGVLATWLANPERDEGWAVPVLSAGPPRPSRTSVRRSFLRDPRSLPPAGNELTVGGGGPKDRRGLLEEPQSVRAAMGTGPPWDRDRVETVRGLAGVAPTLRTERRSDHGLQRGRLRSRRGLR